LAGLLLLAAPAAPAHAICASPNTVNGVWTANDGGTYRLHVVGNTVWWVGTSGDEGRSWTNVFRGTRNGNIIDGEWADVRGKGWGSGTLKLRISGMTSMELVSGTGSGYAGRRWGRGGCPDTRQIPAGG
jgi:hypothetical protein